ncbi:MAG: asparagine synthase (glutamine-hydrolyzing) [Candidatus Omnitrophica bacterium CG02_land_8_20_14_3_00__42_8]|nr:MAG: asparagine synthase (glutamine-hydrolyzing) [Candidatus Omnitrophica bacterium CG02_land_8_20_14_3_00__42_8]
MCGIAGIISIQNRQINKDIIKVMCDAMFYRGPDDEGFYFGNSGVNIALGHKRLSIIDLTAAGRQPMSNEDNSLWIVFNGEIYNFKQIREDLIKKGHVFKSNTDTEAVLHLYEEKGPDCLKDLRGMFAFAVWSEKEQRLFLARDRIGKKPLFYSAESGDLVFASELNALMKNGDIKRDVDFASLDEFLNYGYIPAPFTIFESVKKLPPAHFLIWEKGAIKIQRYWNLDYSQKLDLKEEEICERVFDLLKESTKIRLISDVPLGAFLSGGIDSSAIVAVMAQLMSMPVKTFSIGFSDASFNETDFARDISKKFGTDHKEFIIKPDALEVLPQLIRHFGEPYADSSAIPTYYLSKMTRQSVTVALNGDGGDESFGGYERYVAMNMAERHKILPVVLNKLFGKAIKNMPESTVKKDKINRLKKFVASACLKKESRYSEFMSIFNEETRFNCYTDLMKDKTRRLSRKNIIFNEYEKSKSRDLIDSTLFVDLMTYMPGDLLPKVDITSMANSLECRSPFLDHKFLEFSARIPSHFKVRGFQTKYILKKSLKNILPESILKREKMGFGVPIGVWFKNELKKYAHDILMSNEHLKRGYFNREGIKKILDDHASGKANNGAKIWCLLNLELWHREFADK